MKKDKETILYLIGLMLIGVLCLTFTYLFLLDVENYFRKLYFNK